VNLCWDNFETYINSAVKKMRYDDNLCDVTLVCDDGEMKAHRVILSACSPFFSRAVGKTLSHAHPLLYLRGVGTRILTNILDYMYLGTVNMLRDDLSDMLHIASDLKICGLTTTQGKDSTGDNENDLESGSEDSSTKKKKVQFKDEKVYSPPMLVKKIDEENSCQDDKDSVLMVDFPEDGGMEDGGYEEDNHLQLYQEEEEEELPLLDMDLVAPPHDESNKDEILDSMLDRIVVRKKSAIEGTWHECRVCQKKLKLRENLRRHAEKHITGFKHQCLYCNRFYSTRPSLQAHIHVHRKDL